MGSGWGNLTIKLSKEVLKMIAIEPDKKNIDEAKNEQKKGEYTILSI
jgi:16S rRNA A1518/A1519 N6-dimethyltransferase RsmA/KsgA/DIM1 with predicted DNA glycosylase/AP lyase activity